MNTLKKDRRLPVVVCVLALAAVGNVTTASADLVVIPPTPLSSDPDQQLLNSIATLSAFQEAVDNAPPEGRVIQLEPGVYDFSAVVIFDPADPANPRENYSIGFGGAHWYNPHQLTPSTLPIGGVAVLGKHNVTIQGVSGTTIRGNSDSRALCPPLHRGNNHNVLFTVAGDFGTPSRDITFRNTEFENFADGVVAASAWSAFPGHDPRLGVGTEDLLIENSSFEVQGIHALVMHGQHLRPTVQNNRFESFAGPPPCNLRNDRGVIIMFGPLEIDFPGAPHLVEARITDNAFLNSWIATEVRDQDGTVISNNTIEEQPGGVGIVVANVLPSSGSVIKGNRVRGGFSGIGIFGSGWTVWNNEVHGATFGVWTEWNLISPPTVIVPPSVPFELRWQLIAASGNIVRNNNLTGNAVGIFVGAYARDNEFQGNNVTGSGFAGYFLSGPEDLGFLRFGPASGNTIIGAALTGAGSTVIDASGCYPGLGGCPQLDDDRDGLVNEDPIDFANNDGDLLFGVPLVEEDPEEKPNFITGMQAVYGPSTPPWAQPSNLSWTFKGQRW